MILIIDNYDSFVYNIYQAFGSLGIRSLVRRNDEIAVEEVKKLSPTHIVLSPGPGNPANKKDFGVCSEILQEASSGKLCAPILGVCLGHQGIIAHFGGKIIRNTKPMHGKTSQVEHSGKELFKDVTNPLSVMRYHSLIGDQNAFPECLEITARSLDDNVIMAVQHKELPIFGVQFHPESIMTEEGSKILKNFLEVQRLEVKKC